MKTVRKVLLIDDMFTIRTFIKGLLRDRGYTLLEANNGEEGLELARRERPDLIITDVKMPRKSGIEVCRAVRADPALAAVPVLILTGEKDEVGTQQLAQEAGATAYLRKPIDVDQLQATVTKLLG